MSFKITGPGLYRTRDGRNAQVISAYVVQTGSTFWQGRIGDVELSWEENGMFLRYSSGNDIVAKYGESWAPPQTPYHRTDQFRAETAVKLLLEMARNPKPRWADTALLAVETVDALIAFLDTPQEYENEPPEWTGEAVKTKAQLHRVHNQVQQPNGMPDLDWSKVPDGYDWAAAQPDGVVRAYKSIPFPEPEIPDWIFHEFECGRIKIHGDNWRNTLTRRPEVSK